MTILLFAIGFLFYMAAKIETIIIDKDNNKFEMCFTSMICRNQRKSRELKDLFAFNAFKKGHEGIWMSTVEFVIKAEFRKERSITIL